MGILISFLLHSKNEFKVAVGIVLDKPRRASSHGNEDLIGLKANYSALNVLTGLELAAW